MCQKYNNSGSASIAVVEAVCDIEGVEPVDAPNTIGFTLSDHVDPEALDRVLDGDSGNVTVELTIEGHRIRITDTGRISVEPSRDYSTK